jgi:erythronate-4-phosphate dehydrogenase
MKIVADQNIPFVKKCFSSIGEVFTCQGREISSAIVKNADILLVRSVTRVDEHLLSGTKIKFVATATIGTDHLDIDYLEKHGIAFASAPGSNANSVAEYIIAAILTIAEKHHLNISGKTLGIIGVGHVGSLVASRAASLDLNVLLNDPPLSRQTNDPKYLPLDKLYDCDFITMHTPLSFSGIDKTLHLANEHFFDAVKKGAVFLNTARGGVHDTKALKDAIKKGHLLSAVLDVWENEPYIDAELLEMSDLATPHIAGYSYDGKLAGLVMIYNAVCRFLKINPSHTINHFLPPSAIPSIELSAPLDDEQAAINHIVKRIYDIQSDDQQMRQILSVPTYNRGKLFDELRKNYPVRREFQNTIIKLNDKNGSLAKKLSGIGFQIAQL